MEQSGEQRMTLAEVLLDLAQQPERLLELEDAEDPAAKTALLEAWYPGLVIGGRRTLVTEHLHQIRVSIEADIVASDGHTVKITWLIITW